MTCFVSLPYYVVQAFHYFIRQDVIIAQPALSTGDIGYQQFSGFIELSAKSLHKHLYTLRIRCVDQSTFVFYIVIETVCIILVYCIYYGKRIFLCRFQVRVFVAFYNTPKLFLVFAVVSARSKVIANIAGTPAQDGFRASFLKLLQVFLLSLVQVTPAQPQTYEVYTIGQSAQRVCHACRSPVTKPSEHHLMR